ncbi:beta-propeller domain-containing protein [Vulgatibacter incomptus]|uniref:Lipoprotein n=1 Tax=Vulgatibacter incomptus TaxID=1391653 RepID=A0A0K1PIP1_9BACT|nr:beta-propeller domain-containing protein [Vulgatibacter incomptus]AKU92979.1 hypothetical protein AKJ08_3366 [Vulgatibacter incomptus]
MAHRIRWLVSVIGVCLATIALVSCSQEGSPLIQPTGPQKEPQPGESRFVSADGYQGQKSPDRGGGDGVGSSPDTPETGGGDGGSSGRTVEEGDIYRSFGSGLVLGLNAYRGLQVLDLRDLSAPAVLGRAELSGTPVELYVVGDHAIVLLNDWQGYYGSRYAATVNRASGGVVMTVDLSDPARPVVIDRQVVPGWIYKSRLSRGNGQTALYVVAQNYGYVDADGQSTWSTNTVVKSFQVDGGTIAARTELALGGWIRDIQATPEALLVARDDWTDSYYRSSVSVIDISSADGTMIAGGEVQVAGRVANQFNMDLYNGVLRVVSGRTWGTSGNANHLETFDATDIANLRRIDSKNFGVNEDLYATLFVGNSAFFVTYERRDPFHAFEIRDDGVATEKSQFIVSGWNDFFRPTFGGDRLIGIGTEDTGGRTMAVSLYDTTNLENPQPLVQRATVAVSSSWSEASWDHRAFSVVENAVSVPGPDGVVETGLVLLPFSGWNSGTDEWTASVQIFTFSRTSLTRRGLMSHGTPVLRSFLVADASTANLSEESLSLFSTVDPDRPTELGRLDLAPRYGDLLVFGEWSARLREASDLWSYRSGSGRSSSVQIIPSSAHPDDAAPVATIQVPAGTSIHKVGGRLVTLSMEYATSGWETTIRTWDLSDPAHPSQSGSLVTRDIAPFQRWGWGWYGDKEVPPMSDCFGCGYYGYGTSQPEMYQVGNALAFVDRTPQSASMGTARICNSWPRDEDSCWRTPGRCTDHRGYRTCVTLRGSTTCEGEVYECTWRDGEYQSCDEVDPTGVSMSQSCYQQELTRYWSSFVVRVLDLGRPDALELGRPLAMPANEEAVDVVPEGNRLFLSYKKPYAVAGDSRPYVQYFIRAFDLSTPSDPRQGAAVNVPGQLLSLDGNTIFTRNLVWGSSSIESAVARLVLRGDVAELQAHKRFPNRIVDQTLLDGAGHLLVSHRPRWTDGGAVYGSSAGVGSSDGGSAETSYVQSFSILDARSPTLADLATAEVDDWASLEDARSGRALFQVPGGLLVFNLDRPEAPYPQAFFALKGWPERLHVEGRRILVPAGPYGIYSLGLDEENLVSAP